MNEEQRVQSLMFFDGHQTEAELFFLLTEKLDALGLDYELQFRKTQISFYHRYMFACASLTRVVKKKDRPEPYLTVTFGLGYPVDSPRIAAATEAARGRWTHHVPVSREEELNSELLGWLTEAHAFSGRK